MTGEQYPVDVLVIHEAATFPGLVMECKVIGVLEILEHDKKKERNDRVMAVPIYSHAEQGCLGWRGPKRALQLIMKSASKAD